MTEAQDQAEGLRRLAGKPRRRAATGRLRCIAIASGKGGVGKTTLCVGLGYCLARRDRRVLVFDADLGLANVDIQMGLDPLYTIQDVLFGNCSLDRVVVRVEQNLDVLPSCSGAPEMADMGDARRRMFAEELLRFAAGYDFLLIDASAGIGRGVTTFLSAAPEVLVVVANEPTSIMDAYSLVKVLCRADQPPEIRMVANMVRSLDEGEQLAGRLQTITRRFLNLDLPLAGVIPFDTCVRDAIRARRPVMVAAPQSAPAQCLRELAESLATGQPRRPAARPREAFFEQLAGVALERAGGGGP